MPPSPPASLGFAEALPPELLAAALLPLLALPPLSLKRALLSLEQAAAAAVPTTNSATSLALAIGWDMNSSCKSLAPQEWPHTALSRPNL
jgi:hypothetical protein